MLVKVQESEIHGNGVFASGPIEVDEWQNIYGHTVGTWNPYCFEGDPFFQPYAPWCYLNHSEEPNCVAEEDENGNLYILAIRDIEVGEELTFDYNNGGHGEAPKTSHKVW